MKYFFSLALALVMMATQPVLAEETQATDASDAQSDSQSMVERGGGGFVPGLIIGGIIGGAIVGSGPYYYPPRPAGGWTCYARSGRGEMFSARARHQSWAQDRALEKCYRWSRYCRLAGCEGYW